MYRGGRDLDTTRRAGMCRIENTRVVTLKSPTYIQTTSKGRQYGDLAPRILTALLCHYSPCYSGLSYVSLGRQQRGHTHTGSDDTTTRRAPRIYHTQATRYTIPTTLSLIIRQAQPCSPPIFVESSVSAALFVIRADC